RDHAQDQRPARFVSHTYNCSLSLTVTDRGSPETVRASIRPGTNQGGASGAVCTTGVPDWPTGRTTCSIPRTAANYEHSGRPVHVPERSKLVHAPNCSRLHELKSRRMPFSSIQGSSHSAALPIIEIGRAHV